MAQFQAAVGLQEVERGVWGYSSPSQAKLERWDGVRWHGGWWWLCLPTDLPLLLLFFSTPSPTPNPRYRPLVGCVTIVRGQLRACGGQET